MEAESGTLEAKQTKEVEEAGKQCQEVLESTRQRSTEYLRLQGGPSFKAIANLPEYGSSEPSESRDSALEQRSDLESFTLQIWIVKSLL